MSIRRSFLAACLLGAAVAGVPCARAQSALAAPIADTRQGSYFTVNGSTIFYQEAGSGPDMLLIHGFPLSGALFERQFAQLSASFHVIVVDLPGFGKSTGATNTETDASYADDMLALLAHLNVTKVAVGGHSMGGQITLEMYAKNPTLFSGMILFDTNPNAASIIEMHEWPGFSAQARMVSPASLAPTVVPIMVTGHALAMDPALGTKITAIVSAASVSGVAGGVNALVTRPDYKTLLGSITVPALVIVGEDDPLYAVPISEQLKSGIPGAQLLIVPNAGHASMFQRPAVADAGIVSWAKMNGLIQ